MNLTLHFPPTWFYCFHAAFSVEASDFQARLLWELHFKSLSNRFARGPAEVVQLAPSKDSQCWPTALNGFSKSWYSFSHLCCWTTCASSHSATSAALSCCSYSGRHGSFTNLSGCKHVGLLNETPWLFFFFFWYKEQHKVNLQPRKTAKEMKILKPVFSKHLPKEFVTVLVIFLLLWIPYFS